MHQEIILKYLAAAFGFMVTACFFLAWFYWQRARHREMMSMIEKGIDPAEHIRGTGLKLRTIAAVLTGLGAGALVTAILTSLGFQGANSQNGTFAAFALCTGAALYLSGRFEKAKRE